MSRPLSTGPRGPDRIILWRHGRTEWNATGRGQGQLDIPLDDTGRRQVLLAAPYVAALGPDGILSSDLVRASDTAAEVARLTGLPVRGEPRLREMHLGRMQGLTHDEARERFPADYAAFERGDLGAAGRERPDSLMARAVPAVLDRAGGTLLVVSHGGTIRALLNALLELPRERWRDALGPLGNCRWSEIRRRRGAWQLVAHNTGPDLVPDDSPATAQDIEPAIAGG
ncbi:MAG: histidine phosphatase family protein [Actinomycetota bacterium]|nr:histidine phosphatase family protein [Actinomycetota bacterium]